MKFVLAVSLVLSLSLATFPQRTEPASKEELAEITARGRMLYDYDVAAWHSTDAVMALSPPEGSIERYIARKEGAGWVVVYGRLNETRDKFLVVYEARQGKAPTEFDVEKPKEPKEDTDFFLAAAHAIDIALKEFGSASRPYNVAVLPAKDDQLHVYLVPAQTDARVFPLGGDARYLISGDGKKIIRKRQLHNAVIEFKVPEGMVPETGFHTAILDDVPEDTDVFHVLTRKPKVPELIMTDKYVYRVATDGSILYLMTSEAFRKSVENR
ncbi:MAG: hypothetical protein J5I65_08720 [Aridibacter famidurans]|nr:hypothetical protein [Aridibacter famidurans]